MRARVEEQVASALLRADAAEMDLHRAQDAHAACAEVLTKQAAEAEGRNARAEAAVEQLMMQTNGQA